MPGADDSDALYWYGDAEEDRTRRAVAVLHAFRVYRAAELAMRRRTRRTMGMGENELLVLRYLLKARAEERAVTPTELARFLGISTASMTAMIDRLQNSGHVERRSHPTDRRRIHVVVTEKSDEEVRETLGPMHERMLAAVADMDAEQSRVVIACLERLQEALDAVDAP